MTLNDFFTKHNKVALAFSGGTDSAYLLYAAKTAGADVAAYFVRSEFQPEFELTDALTLADSVGAELKIIDVSVLSDGKIVQNTAKRCYYCKQKIFSAIISRAAAYGYDTVIDGTNASDNPVGRPGFAALQELGVLSPLREAGLTKTEIRNLSAQAGLFTAEKPSYSCLATRIRADETVTAEKLQKIERAETVMFGRGYSDFRVRLSGNSATLEINVAQKDKITAEFPEIKAELSQIFDTISISEVYRK